MLTDTHAHLYYPELICDLGNIIERAKDKGIERIIVPAVDLQTSLRILEISAEHPEIYCALGIHPCDAAKAKPGDLEQIKELLKNKRAVAVGETGLDYYWDTSTKEVQRHYFREQIRLAAECRLPVVIHTRESIDDAIGILKEECGGMRILSHFHCFSGTVQQLEQCLSIDGASVSFCGNVTYKNSVLGDAVKAVPPDRLLCETDSPFLPPVPYRGKRNEPAYMLSTIECIARIKEIDTEQLKQLLSDNVKRFYRGIL